jgi:hypothetical protein
MVWMLNKHAYKVTMNNQYHDTLTILTLIKLFIELLKFSKKIVEKNKNSFLEFFDMEKHIFKV